VSDTHIVKTLVAPNPIETGQPVTYRLTATNDGPSIAPDVVISDTVPDGLTFHSAALESGEACQVPDLHDQQPTVRGPVGTLTPGAWASGLVVSDAPLDFRGELCNSALVGSGSLDPDSTDNEQQVCGDVVVMQPAPPGGAPSPPPPVSLTTRCTSTRRFTI